MSISIKDYIEKYLFDQISGKIVEYTQNNKEYLETLSYKMENFDDSEVMNIIIKNIHIDASYDSDSLIYIISEVEIALTQYGRQGDDFDIIYPWIIVKCIGSVRNRFKDFSILDINQYNLEPKLKNPLSETLIPYMKKDNLDNIATDFLEKFYPEVLDQENIVPVNPVVLADRLGLEIEEHEISDDNSVFGSIIFEPCTIETFIDGEINKIFFEEGTIIVDPNIFFLRNIGSVNNTIIHECVHWRFHKKGFELERLYNSDLNMISCKVTGEVGDKDQESLKWMEWQANSLAPRIQMPITTFKIKCSEYIRKNLTISNSDNLIDVIEDVISDLSEFFGVSKQSAKIRMIDTGFEEAKGAFIYLNGRYIEPHYDSNYKLKENETYSLDTIDLAIEYIKNPSLKELIDSGVYAYIDAHVILDDPKYVQKNFFGQYELTNYAKSNMNECCLVFEIEVLHTSSKLGRFYTECYLCRVIDQEFSFQVNFNSKEGENENSQQALANYVSQTTKLLRNMPSAFGPALEFLIKESNMTLEKIAEKSYCDEKTIRRYKKEEANPSIRTLIAICIALELPPTVSKRLIDISPCKIPETMDEGQTLSLILNICKTVDEANKLLESLNLDPLSKNF
ncbi:helix-turn-helix domain-containing protein [Miniphocaeibacter massiliensis]|uniref:helix-turn-helix domain-containing protein n=1 Tax=Miniphocaeibacter massiliensis TaxID=2041841 RepID=UPI000C1B96A7|nr:helix-turn-helix transcriptional regulator [Miniphocaeibacter massiliensis]